MKFTICGFSQEKLVAYKLDSVDALILRYFIDFKDSGNMKIIFHNNKPFYWLNYKQLLKELPVLKIRSKDALRDRLKKLEKCGVLEHYLRKEKGTFSFYAIDNNYKCLIDTEGYGVKSRQGTEQNPDGYGAKSGQGTEKNPEQNINLLKDSSIKDNNTKDEINWRNILTAWNTLPDPIKNIQAITDSRKIKVKARINSLNLKPQDIMQAINNIKNSGFLQGKNDKGWVITFDWLFKDDTRFSKVLEGNYSNAKSKIQDVVNTNLQNAAAYEPFNYS